MVTKLFREIIPYLLVILISLPVSLSGQLSGIKWLNYSRDYLINDIYTDSTNIWVASQGGLARINRVTEAVTNFNPANSGLTSININSIESTNNDSVMWFATQYGGLVRFDGTNWSNFKVVNPGDTIAMALELASDKLNNLWISSLPNFNILTNSFRLFKYDGASFTGYALPQFGPGTSTALSMTCDTLGNLWTVTNHGLCMYDGSSWTILDSSTTNILGLPREVTVDNNNRVWTINYLNGTNNVLSKYDGTTFTNYFFPYNGTLSSLDADENNNILICNGGQILRFDGISFTNISGLPTSSNALCKSDDNGNYFVGSWSYTDTLVYQFDSNFANAKGFFTSNSPITANYGQALAIDKNDIRWIQMSNFDLNRFDGIHWTYLDSANSGILSTKIQSLFSGSDGTLWIGYESSTPIPLSNYDGNAWQYHSLSGLAPWVFEITEDLVGNIWVATYGGIGKYEGGSWTYYNSVLPTVSKVVLRIAIDNLNNVLGAVSNSGLIKYDGTNWSLYDPSNSGIANYLIGDFTVDQNNHLWLTFNDTLIQRFDGTNWVTYTPSQTGLTYPAGGVNFNKIDNSIWFCGQNEVLKYDGVSWQRFDQFNSGIGSGVYNVVFDKHNNKWFYTHSGGVVVFNENGINYETIYHLPPANIAGKVYYDQDLNGEFNSSVDHGVSARKIFLKPDSLFTFTSLIGDYIMNRDTGNYILEYHPDSNWYLTSDSAAFTFHLDSTGIDSLNFGTSFTGIETAAEISCAAMNDRCNTVGSHLITFRNKGTTVLDGQIVYVKDSLHSFVSAVPPPVSIFGDTLTWQFNALLQFEQRQILVNLMNPPPQPLGTMLNLAGSILINQIVLDADSILQETRCSFDPNDKLVFPAGTGPENEVINGQELNYTIRFQNTGNDTAFFVMILDTLNASLDMSTFEFLSSSHPANISCAMNGAVQFRFDNINLLWSSFNEPASHGFVKFRIKPKPNLTLPAVVVNNAYIYFDFNQAIVTNTVLTTYVDSMTSVGQIEPQIQSAVLYPNPGNGSFSVKLPPGHDLWKIKVYDYTSRLITSSFNYQSETEIHLPQGSNGLFIVTIQSATGNMVRLKAIVNR